MDKTTLLNKGNELIDIISTAMTMIEITDGAKDKVSNPFASICISLPIEDTDYTDQYDLAQCLSPKSVEAIKQFINSEIDKAQHDACHTLERMGLRTPAIVNQDFEKEVEKMVEHSKPVPPDRSLPAEKIQEIQKRADNGESIKDISRAVGVSTSTARKYINGRSAC